MARDRWNFTTLRQLMDERDVRYQQRYEAQQKALDAALLAAKEAVLKAELSADKRLELLNELRTGVATVEQLEAMDKVVTSLSKRIDMAEGRTTGKGVMWGYLVAGAGVLAAVLSLVLH